MAPTQHAVLFAERVAAAAFAHQLVIQDGPVLCWSYVTSGMREYGQEELVFTMLRDDDSVVPPQAPFLLLRTIASLAAQGRTVNPGGFTELGPTGFLGNPQLRGFAYERSWPLGGVPLPAGCLSMIALHGPEVESVQAHGTLRTLARIGRAYRSYPTAAPCDPTREPIGPTDPPGLLAKVPSARFRGVTVASAGERLHLRVATQAREALASQLPQQTGALALLASLDPAADACLVWTPGQDRPEAIQPPGSTATRIAGCFLMIVPAQATDTWQMFEDGFTLLLTDPTTARLHAALTRGHPLDLPALSLSWHDEP